MFFGLSCVPFNIAPTWDRQVQILVLLGCFVDVVWVDLNRTPERVGGIPSIKIKVLNLFTPPL